MPLQFDVQAVAEELEQRIKAGSREMALAGRDGHVEGAARSARQRNEVRSFSLQPFEPEARRLVRRRVEKGARIKPYQAPVTLAPRGQQHDTRAFRCHIDVAR